MTAFPSPTMRTLRHTLSTLAAAMWALPAQSQFAAAITPPRFEVDAPPGKVSRQVIEIMNPSPLEAQFRLYTSDWTLSADGQIGFSEALTPGSCRPWVAIERKQVKVAPGTRLRYRFEITPPEGTPPMECRFAVMIESGEQAVESGPIKVPMSGRIGVIVYARVGDVQPRLSVIERTTTLYDGKAVPTLRVRNDGQATGRFTGYITGKTADGRTVDLSPNSVPILPGMTRSVELLPAPPIDRPQALPPELRWPVQVSGSLEIEGTQQAPTPLAHRFDGPKP